MPTYTYRCENCGVQFDLTLKFTDPQPTKCPECNKKTLRKIFTPVGIVFKGSGFYATDHRSPSGQTRPGSQAEKSAESKSEESKPSSSESSSSPKESSGSSSKESGSSSGSNSSSNSGSNGSSKKE
jgi:putative FmdB family regulatory protein